MNDYGMMMPLRLQGKELDDSDDGRRMRYRRYLDFYNGEQFSIPAKAGERRLTVNYARLLVNKTASFMLGAGVKYECANPAAEEALAKVATDNGLNLLDYETAIDAAILGDGAWKVTGASTPPSFIGKGAGGLGLRVRSVDVFNLAVEWAGDDVRRVRQVTESYELSPEEVSRIFGVQLMAGADYVQVSEVWTAGEFRLQIEGQAERVRPNPYGFIPYVLFPNLRRPRLFWGESDLADIMELCSELNTRLSVMSQILQLSGNPVLVLENVQDSSGLRVGPGAVWHLPEDSKAYLLNLLEHGGLDAHLNYISTLYQSIHDLAEMPQAAFGRSELAGRVSSGVALDVLLQPVIQKIARKRAIWTDALTRRAKLILLLLGFGADTEVRVNWPPILPRDYAGLVANEIALVGQGIHSRMTANRNLGEESPAEEVATALYEAREWAKAGGKSSQLKVSGALVQGLANAAG